MNLFLEEHLPSDFSSNCKVWVYQSNRLFFMKEALEMEEMLSGFVANWKSHGEPVKAYANLFFGRFIVVMADEDVTAVGGCSTDASVRFIKQIEQRFKVNMFDRLTLAFYIKDKVETIPMSQLGHGIESGLITPETLFFNNSVHTKKELMDDWIAPAGKSWLSRYFAVA